MAKDGNRVHITVDVGLQGGGRRLSPHGRRRLIDHVTDGLNAAAKDGVPIDLDDPEAGIQVERYDSSHVQLETGPLRRGKIMKLPRRRPA